MLLLRGKATAPADTDLEHTKIFLNLFASLATLARVYHSGQQGPDTPELITKPQAVTVADSLLESKDKSVPDTRKPMHPAYVTNAELPTLANDMRTGISTYTCSYYGFTIWKIKEAYVGKMH